MADGVFIPENMRATFQKVDMRPERTVTNTDVALIVTILIAAGVAIWFVYDLLNSEPFIVPYDPNAQEV